MGLNQSLPVEEVHGAPKTLSELMEKKLFKSNYKDEKWFTHVSMALASLSGISAMVINSAVRRQLMIYEVAFPAAFATGVIGSLFNLGARQFYIEMSLLEGHLSCGSCAIIRGGFIQGLTSSFIPAVMSFIICGIVADKYNTLNMPPLEMPPSKEFRSFLRRQLPQLLRPLRYLGPANVVLGGLVVYKQYLVVQDLRSSITKEEMRSLWNEASRSVRDLSIN